MTKAKIFATAAILASALAGPAMAQEVIYNPGYCAQFYPNANCQNRGPGSPYDRSSYQRQTYRDGAYQDRAWRDSNNRWDGPGDLAAGVVGGRSVRRQRLPPIRSSARITPVATALSVSPGPCSAARTAGGISASRAARIASGKAAGKAAFFRGGDESRP